MALITGYASAVTSVQNYLARGDLASDVPGFIQNWEERFFRQPRNYGAWMDAELSETITSSVIAVPTGFLAFRHVYVDGAPAARLEQVSPEQLYGRYPRGDYTGFPVWIARVGNNFEFGPEPDDDYTIAGVYRAKPTALRNYASDAAAHWIIVNAPDLLLYGALLEAEPFLKNDSRVMTWKTFYADALKDYREHWEEQEMSSQEVLA